MKTLYHLTHGFNGLTIENKYDNLFTFTQELDKLMDDRYVLNDTIQFRTEVIKPIQEDKQVVYVQTGAEIKREHEYMAFNNWMK